MIVVYLYILLCIICICSRKPRHVERNPCFRNMNDIHHHYIVVVVVVVVVVVYLLIGTLVVSGYSESDDSGGL